MSAFTEIMEYIRTFEKYGCKEYENGTKEYGHAPFIAPEAYNFCVFATLIETEVSQKGGHILKRVIEYRDRLSREKRWEQMDEDLDYDKNKLDHRHKGTT